MRHSADRFPTALFLLCGATLVLAVLAGEALTCLGGM